jgi:hypothetical protein
MRVRSIPKKNAEIINNNKQLFGWWNSKTSVIKWLNIEKIGFDNKIIGSVIITPDKKCRITGNYKNKGSSLVITISTACGNASGTILLKYNNEANTLIGSFISDNGEIVEKIKFIKRDQYIKPSYASNKVMEPKANNNIVLYKINDADGYTNLRKEPKGAIIQKVFEKERFTVLKKDGNYYLIELKDGTKGYIHASRVVKAEPSKYDEYWQRRH